MGQSDSPSEEPGDHDTIPPTNPSRSSDGSSTEKPFAIEGLDASEPSLDQQELNASDSNAQSSQESGPEVSGEGTDAIETASSYNASVEGGTFDLENRPLETSTSSESPDGQQLTPGPEHEFSQLGTDEGFAARWLGIESPVAVWEWTWVAICFLGGAWLRCTNMAGRPLWTDEFTTLITASKRGLFESFFTQQDPQPPLYQLLLRFVMLFTGDHPGEWAVRGPAVVAGVLCVVVVWWYARMLFSPLIAALVSVAIAVNPLMVYYSREARPYSWFALGAILSMGFFYQLIRTGRRGHIVGYAVATGVMFLSHYYAIFCVAAQLLFLAGDLVCKGPSRRHIKPVIIGFVAALAASLPAVLLFGRLLYQGMSGAWWIARPSPIDAVDALGDLMGLRVLGVACLVPLVSAFWLTRTPLNGQKMSRQILWTRRLAVWVAGGDDEERWYTSHYGSHSACLYRWWVRIYTNRDLCCGIHCQ